PRCWRRPAGPSNWPSPGERGCPPGRTGRRPSEMAIIIDENTRVVVQGLTGREGRFHALRNRDYGTKVAAGVTPGKGGTDVEGVPACDTMIEAVTETCASASIIVDAARITAHAAYLP